MYLQGTVMHEFSIGNGTEKHKKKLLYAFLLRQTVGRQTVATFLKKGRKPREKIQTT